MIGRGEASWWRRFWLYCRGIRWRPSQAYVATPLDKATERLGSRLLGEMKTRAGLPRPDWDAVSRRWRALPEADLDAGWRAIERVWLDRLASAWRDKGRSGFNVWSEKDVCLVTDLKQYEAWTLIGHAIRLAEWVDKSLASHGLGPISEPYRYADTGGWFGGDVLVVCRHRADFIEFVNDSFPEAFRGGIPEAVCLYTGLVHVAAYWTEWDSLCDSIRHQLIHTRLSAYALPDWLDYGITLYLESRGEGPNWLHINRDILMAHRGFWNSARLGRFFGQGGFGTVEDGDQVAYRLAATMVLNFVAANPTEFANVLRAVADGADVEAAFETHFGSSPKSWLPQYVTEAIAGHSAAKGEEPANIELRQ